MELLFLGQRLKGGCFFELSLGGFFCALVLEGFFNESAVPEKGKLGGLTDSCFMLIIRGSEDWLGSLVLYPDLVVGMFWIGWVR